MADEFKSIRDNLFKVLTGKGDRDETPDDGVGALLGAIFQRAGKGKDEVVGIVAREIGVAVAAMLKEPMAALAKNQKLQISFEFVPKDGVAEVENVLRSVGENPIRIGEIFEPEAGGERVVMQGSLGL